jgi:hypothetical protein
MTKLSETLCPKTGSNASNYIRITSFTSKSIQTARDHHRLKCIRNNLNHFAELLRRVSAKSKDCNEIQHDGQLFPAIPGNLLSWVGDEIQIR